MIDLLRSLWKISFNSFTRSRDLRKSAWAMLCVSGTPICTHGVSQQTWIAVNSDPAVSGTNTDIRSNARRLLSIGGNANSAYIRSLDSCLHWTRCLYGGYDPEQQLRRHIG